MKILLIDDNNEDMKQFCDELILDDFEVLQAFNFEDVKRLCTDKVNIDFILLDLMFPPTNGIPIVESEYGFLGGKYLYDELVASAYPNVPFIVLTAMDSSTKMYQDVDKHFMETYKWYLGIFQKPVEIDEIIGAYKQYSIGKQK